MLKRTLSLLMSLLLIVSMVPVGALAEDPEPVEASEIAELPESSESPEQEEASAPSEPEETTAPSEPEEAGEDVPELSIYITAEDDRTELPVSGKLQLTVHNLPEESQAVLTWSSSDELVAVVDETGLVTGVAAGTVAITAQYGDMGATIHLTVTDLPEEEEAVQFVSCFGTYVNPMYAGVEALPAEGGSATAALSEQEPYTQVSDLVAPLREYMCARAGTVVLPLELPVADFDEEVLMQQLDDVLDKTMTHTGVPTQGDYLRANFQGARYGYTGTVSSATASLQISFELTYNDTADQEAEMDTAVRALLTDLSPTGTDYEKLLSVYDYITKNIVYDHDNLNNEAYLLKFSPYAALVNKTAVCQGYAGLLYRLALELGIPCRMITGIGNGGLHAWNIVGLEGKYYNVDATWDAGLTQYMWFLLTDDNFSDHARDEAYTTAGFYSAYPMGTSNYTPPEETPAEIIASGSCGAALTYTLDGSGLLTISGSGAMTNFSRAGAPWYANRAKISRVALPEGLTNIGNYAFYECTKLSSVTIPTGVSSIGSNAFLNCLNLKTVHIPAEVRSIGSYAFEGCTALTSLVIPEGVSAINYGTFYGCTGLKSVSIPSTVTKIGSSAFYKCSSLTGITLPVGLKTVDSGAFSNCGALTAATIPEGVTAIPYSLFSNCSALTRVTLPQGITSIGYEAFFGCAALEELAIPDSVNTIGYSAFCGCASLTEMAIPAGITAIPNSLFYGCTSLKAVTIPAGVVSIGSNAFYGCALTEVTIPEDAVSIGMYAFKNCAALTKVTIPDSVTTIGEYAFSGCAQLQSITIPAGVTKISYGTFNDSGLRSVTLPKGVTDIGQYAFSGCASLSSITIPDSVSTIGTEAFYECAALSAITIPAGITDIESRTFKGCTSLTSISIPEKVQVIGYGAFEYCTSLTSVSIPKSVTAIEPYAFNGCSKLTAVTYAGTMEEWVALSYRYAAVCTDGTVLDLGSCGENLRYMVTGSGSLILLGSGAMNTYSYESSVPWYAYRKQISTIVLPEGLTSISQYAFYRFESLTRASIPAGVTTIEAYAFKFCSALREITFAHTGTDSLTIGMEAFWLSSEQAMGTRVRVPSVRDIHTAISGYDWAGSSRSISWLSTGNIPITTLTIGDHAAQLEAGLELPFHLTVEPYNATSEILWSIDVESSTGTAAINGDGVLTALTPGYVTVRAVSADNAEIYDTTQLEILPPTAEVDAIQVTADWEFEGEAEVGTTLQMRPVFIPGNTADKSVIWSVDNGTGTATIDQNGLLTALSTGTVTVWATAANGVEGSCSVNIVRYTDDITILLDGLEGVTSLGVGQRMILSARVSPEEATNTKVFWSLENGTGSAEIKTYRLAEGDPEITGLTPGTVTLYAISQDNRSQVVSVELTISDVIRSYPVTGGNLYYNTESGVITGCDTTVTQVTIPARIDGVAITGIAPYAFSPRDSYWGQASGIRSLKAVSIPATVTYIGEQAFAGCENLESLRFGTGSRLTTIESRAFSGCAALKTVVIPEGVTTIKDWAFSGCENITTLTLPGTLTTMGKTVFSISSGLKSLTLPGELNAQGSMYIGDVVECVTFTGSRVISPPYELIEEEWGNSLDVERMPGRRANKFVVSKGITTLEDFALYGTEATEIVLPDSLRTLGRYALANNRNLETLQIPETVESVGQNCFEWTRKLQLIDISAVPDRITEQEYPLNGKAVVPAWLIRATGGRTRTEWMTYNEEGNVGIGWSYSDCFLCSEGNGSCDLVCMDPYTGASGTKQITFSAGLAIRPKDQTILAAGEQLQLSAVRMPGEHKVTALWSLAEGDTEYATLSSTGLLTAKNVTAAQLITVTARDQTDTVFMKFWILPRTASMRLYAEGGDTPVGESGTPVQTLNADLSQSAYLTLTALSDPGDASQNVEWTSSDPAVAKAFSTGTVRLYKPGTAVITATATDGTGIRVSVKLNVFYLDDAKTLTASTDAPSIGLQAGQTTLMRVFGSDKSEPLSADRLVFSIPDTQQKFAVVDGTGCVTALSAGTVTITARIVGDPLNRTVSLKLPIIPVQSESLAVVPDVPGGKVTMLDEAGNVTEDPEACAVYCVLLDKSAQPAVFTLNPEAVTSTGSTIRLGKSGIKWISTDPKLASITALADGSVRVTVPAGVSGACAIRGTTTDLAKNTASTWIFVRDFAPQLESASLAMNSYLEAGVSTGLTESYGNSIETLTVNEFDPASGAYADVPSERLTVAYEHSRLTLLPKFCLAPGTLKLLLRAQCANGQVYDYPVALKVTNKLPGITAKQPKKFNLFYRTSETELLVSVKAETITGLELVDTEDFALKRFDPETGIAVIGFSEAYLDNPTATADTKATLRVFLEGYHTPIAKSVTIGTVTTKPKLTTSPSASIVNTALTGVHTASIRVLNQTTGEYLDLQDAVVEAPFAQSVTKEEQQVILNTDQGGTAKLTVRAPDWTQGMTLTHKVSVQSVLPKVTLGTATLKLNWYFTEQTAGCSMASSQSNLPIDSVRFQPAAAPGTAARQEADKITLEYDAGEVTARISDSTMLPNAGTYAYTYTALLEDGTALPSGTIKVKVDGSLPKVKLSATALKLNRCLAGDEIASTLATVVKNPDYEVVDLTPGTSWPESELAYSFADGAFRVRLISASAVLQRRSLTVYPVLKHIPTGQTVTLPTALGLSVQVYEAAALSVSVSAKGKLDTQQPDSAITYTASKLVNCTGEATAVTLTGADADKFGVELVPGAMPAAKLTMLAGQQYSTKITYKVQLEFTICGQPVRSAVLSVRVTQSALKFTKESGTALYHQSQTAPLTHRVSLTTGLVEEVRLNAKTSPDFLNALAKDGFSFTCAPDGTAASLTFHITRQANLVRNKSYTVYLDVIPANCATDKAPTTLKLTVKVLS